MCVNAVVGGRKKSQFVRPPKRVPVQASGSDKTKKTKTCCALERKAKQNLIKKIFCFQCGEFLQNVVNLFGVLNKIEVW